MRFEIRPAVEADLDAIASVHVLGWRASYRGILPDSLLDSLIVSQRVQLWADWIAGPGVHILIASGPTGVLGFVRLSRARPLAAPPPRTAEVTHLYVHPEQQGFGVQQGAGAHRPPRGRPAEPCGRRPPFPSHGLPGVCPAGCRRAILGWVTGGRQLSATAE